MSYEVIARKWRPKTFDEVIGQDHVTTPLRNAIRSDRVPHAVLLAGPRGVGKTTLARILAHCLNCEQGPTEEPCGTCDSCVEITDGRSTDVQEIDAASRNSVDDVRDLIESIRYAPSPGKYRIYVVDEVHMLSKPAFNALLKTLEEPPPRSLFVFATTEPERIPFTVLSRCQRYDLRRIPITQVAQRLRAIADAESVTISDAGLRAIAREGDGSMRDAQTLMDQILSYGGTDVSDASIAEVLDLTDRSVLLAIARACVEGDAAAALEASAGAFEAGTEASRLASDLMQLFRDLVVLRVAPGASNLVECNDDELQQLRDLSEATDPVRLRRMFRTLVTEQEELGWAPHPFAVFEMTLVRLASLPEGVEVAALVSKLEALEKQLGSGSIQGGRGSVAAIRPAATRPPPRPAPEPEKPRPAAVPETKAGPGDTPAPKAEATATQPVVDATTPAVTPAKAAVIESDASLDEVFDRLRAFAQNQNRGLFASLEGGKLLEHQDSRLCIGVSNAFHSQRLIDRISEVDAICERFFGHRMKIEIRALGGGAKSLSSPENDRESIRRYRKNALENKAINMALKELDAQLVEIRPLGAKP